MQPPNYYKDEEVFDLMEGGEKLELFPTDKVRPLPTMAQLNFKALQHYGPFEDLESYQVAWNMVIDEFGFEPDMANRWNIFKLATVGQLTEDPKMFETLGKDLESLFNVNPNQLLETDGKVWSVVKGEEHIDTIKKRVISTLEKLDKKYDIYTDEGTEMLTSLIKEDKLTLWNLRDLYHNKYKRIYGEIPVKDE